jgi:two-component sensor histidine kinase
MDIMTNRLEIENASCNVGFFTDVTARKQADEELKNTLQEKELFIRELYHRTRNNMQVIYSMLRIYAKELKNKQLRNVIDNIGNKILTMSMVHQKLYESKDLSSLSLRDYFQSLALEMKKTAPYNATEIPILVTGDDVKVLIDTAIPCGLIVNELITNSLRFAFTNARKGKITVHLCLSPENEIVIEVSDNGVGLPNDFDNNKDLHIGLKFVIDIVEHQLQGKINFINRKGLSVQIVLPRELYKTRV